MDDQSKAVAILREYQLFRRREDAQPHMSYAHEKERHRVISEGRVDEIEQVMAIPPDGTMGVLSKDELRNAKNMFISAITLFTRSAMDGGLPEEIADKCRRYLQHMGLNFGCFDFIVTPDGEYVFLECNPNGQWLWVELATGLKIADAIADFLSSQSAKNIKHGIKI